MLSVFTAAIVMALLACSSPGLTIERVDAEQWLSMQAEAARLSGLSHYDPHAIHIEIVPLARVRRIAGDQSAHACVFIRTSQALYCKPGTTYDIWLHEAMHSLQPSDMPRGCRELQAHAVQVAWLQGRGDYERAASVARNASRYHCNIGR